MKVMHAVRFEVIRAVLTRMVSTIFWKWSLRSAA